MNGCTVAKVSRYLGMPVVGSEDSSEDLKNVRSKHRKAD
jgi:hypothetical protein